MKSSMATYTGKLFDFDNIQPSMICIEDIAHSLALINRYNGMTTFPYSVAEHCVRMTMCDDLPGDKLAKLLHDSAEAYIGDLVTPFKRKLKFFEAGMDEEKYYYDIATLEHDIQNAILKAFGIKDQGHTANWIWLNSPGVKQSDAMILAEEIKVLMPQNPECQKEYSAWLDGATPSKTGLTQWNVYPWQKAKTLYLKLFKELTK